MKGRNRYSMAHQWMTRLKIGAITPVFCEEVTQGDTWGGVQHGLIRLDPLALPAFATFDVETYFFYVRHRIIDDTFESEWTGKTSAGYPTINIGTSTNYNNLAGYFGLGVGNGVDANVVRAHPFRAYNKVVEDFFYPDGQTVSGGMDQTGLLYAYHRRGTRPAQWQSDIEQGATETINTGGATLDVREIREAQMNQRYKELKERYGDDFESILRMYGIRVTDMALDRPEFLAKSRSTIGISEVVATATETGAESLGEYVGHGIGGVTTRLKRRFFPEPGTLLGVAVVRPRIQFKNKIDRKWFADPNELYYVPERARMKHVDVLRKEVSSKTTAGTPTDVIGYEPAFQHLRQAMDVVAGPMQDPANAEWTTALDWTSTAVGLSSAQLCQSGDYAYLFQDTSTSTAKMYGFFSNKIGKQSIVPKRGRV